MKILYISPYTPTPIRTRPFNLIHALAKRGHAVTLATLWENEAERQALAEFQTARVQVIAEPLSRIRSGLNTAVAIFSSQPLQARFCWHPTLAQRIALTVVSAQPKFDIIHVEHLRGAQYGLALKADLARRNGGASPIPIVWDSVDCISFLFEQAAQTSRNIFGRLVTRLELPRTRRHEGWLVHQFKRVLVTSEKDRQALEQLGRAHSNAPIPITVLHNGVDLDYFAPTDSIRDVRTIVMTGKMSYHANATAALYVARQVMPRVWQTVPDAQLQIVGSKPTRAVRRLAQENPGRVVVTGSVPDMRAYLSRATIAVAPILYGAGIQNKVLEAMAMATPVVATPKAVSALSVCNGTELLIGNHPSELADQIVRLFDQPGFRNELGARGRHYVEMYHDWHRIAAQLEGVYAME